MANKQTTFYTDEDSSQEMFHSGFGQMHHDSFNAATAAKKTMQRISDIQQNAEIAFEIHNDITLSNESSGVVVDLSAEFHNSSMQ